MKRLREEEKEEAGMGWDSLCADVIRALAKLDPSLLPALYLVNTACREALDAEPSAIYWQHCLYATPGFSDWQPGDEYPTWRALLAARARGLLEPRYYMVLRGKRWLCGSKKCLMYCTTCHDAHSTNNIVLEAERKIEIDQIPRNTDEVRLTSKDTEQIGGYYPIGGTFLFYTPGTLIHVVPGLSHRTWAATLPENRPMSGKWHVEHFIGFL
jgi:hypothetical protein